MRAQTAQWGFPDAAESGSQTRLRYMESGERYDNPSVDSDRYRLSDSGQGLCDSTQHSHFLLEEFPSSSRCFILAGTSPKSCPQLDPVTSAVTSEIHYFRPERLQHRIIL